MSQPPQPPGAPGGSPSQQPPGSAGGAPAPGGFGAPQDPRAGFAGGATGGYPPQQPQGRPSYGYPQAPPPPNQPPQAPPQGQAPPPYGYPGAAQPGPGPQQPYGRQQYGMYPPPSPYPGGGIPPQTPPPATGAGRTVAIVGAVVAALLLVVGGVWFAAAGGDDGRQDDARSSSGGGTGGGSGGVTGELITKLPRPTVNDQVTVEGLWVNDKVFAKGDVDKIVGYDPTGATKRWVLPLPGSICWASRHTTEDGITAVLFQGAKATVAQPHQGCTEVAAIDVVHGKKLWQKSVTADGQKITFHEVTVGDGAVAAGGTSGGAAWQLDSGKRLWAPKQNARCEDAGYAGGAKLVAVVKCGEYDRPTVEIQTLDPRTGRPTSVFEMPSGFQYVHIVSTDPLIAAGEADITANGVSDFMVLDDSTRRATLRSKISSSGDQHTLDCGVNDVEGCKLVVTDKDTLFLASKEHEAQAKYGRTNEILAYDLRTGKAKGKADAGEERTMVPLRMDGDDLIAYKYPTYDKGGQVVRIDPTTYKSTVLLRNPDSTNRTESNFRPELNVDIAYVGGRLYMGQHYVTTHKSAFDEGYLAVVFGAK